MRRLRIAYVYRNFNDAGSLHSFYRRNAERLARDEEVTAFCSARTRTPTSAPVRFATVEPLVRGPGRARAALEIGTFAVRSERALGRRRAGFDVIHVEGVAALRADIVTVHAVRRAEIEHYFGNVEPQARLRRRLTPWLLRPQSGVVMAIERALLRRQPPLCIAPSAAIKADLHRIHGVPFGLIEVIPYGVDTKRFRFDPEARALVRGRLGVPDARMVSLFVGQDFARKGLHRAIAGLARSRSAGELWVVGGGDPSRFRAQAESLGVGARVRFLGRKAHDALPGWVSAADALVLLSQQDAWGQTAMEAMAAGRVPVVSAYTGVSAAITAARCGYVLGGSGDPAELGALLDGPLADPTERARQAERGRVLAEAHDYPSLYERSARSITVPTSAAAPSRGERASPAERGLAPRGVWWRFPGWARRLALALAAVQALVALAYLGAVASPADPLPRQLNLDAEATIGVWWASTLFLAVGALALALWWLAGRSGGHWLVLAIGFAGLSREEVATIHENVGETVGDAIGLGPRTVWPILYAPLLVVGAWAILRAARELDPQLRRATLLALGALVVVLVLEQLSAAGGLLGSSLQTVVEESAEVAGAIVLLVVLATELAERVNARSGGASPVGGRRP